jgi:CRISPR/Cas system CSM-associated protein Csm2 small subunit
MEFTGILEDGIRRINFLVKDMPIEARFRYMKLLETLTAEAAVAYHNAKITERTPDPKAAEKAEDFKKAVKAQKIANLPPKEKKLLSDADKAIAQLVKNGIPESTARRIVEAEMVKEGRGVQI